GAATVSAITCGLAPGYCARTTTDGGTTSGYSEIGRLKIAISPPTKMRIDKTAAKIGLSTKNREKFMAYSFLGATSFLALAFTTDFTSAFVSGFACGACAA